jgi:LacI family transcriptional regulator
MTRGDVPSALVANDDSEVMAAVEAARTAGVRVPEEVSVVGIGNAGPMGAELPLTSVDLNPVQMAEIAVKLLTRRMKSPSAPPERHVVEVNLIKRDSAVPPAG